MDPIFNQTIHTNGEREMSDYRCVKMDEGRREERRERGGREERREGRRGRDVGVKNDI